jgi:hypothetical protein
MTGVSMRKLALASVIAVVLPLTPALGGPVEPPESDGQVRINGEVAQLGDAAALGTRDGTRCTFDGGLEFSQLSEGVTDWAVVRIDDSCTVSLKARWTGELEDAPEGILPKDVSEEWTEESFKEDGSSEPQEVQLAGLGIVAASPVCTTHKAQIIMYGYGGPLDRLTRLVGTMVACETTSTFTSVTHTGTCYATDPPGSWRWVIERCYSGGIIQTSTTAQAIQLGDFHCDPRTTAPCSATNPDGYDHTLKMTERKTRGGSAVCYGSLTGLDVVGSYTDIIQGC